MTPCPLHDITNTAFSPFMADEEVFGAIENPWSIMADYRRNTPVSSGSYGAAFGAPTDPAASQDQAVQGAIVASAPRG